ncbi:Helicase-like transcription factor CHR28 [Linum perenne]
MRGLGGLSRLGHPFNKLSEVRDRDLAEARDIPCLITMAAKEPIDISSDSDLGLDDDYDLDFDESLREGSSNKRILPQWATSSSGAGVVGLTAKAPSVKSAFASNGSSSNRNINQTSSNHGYGENSIASNQNGSSGNPRAANSRIAEVSSGEYEKLSSQQALKRTLPKSLDGGPPSYKMNKLADNASSSQTHGAHRNVYNPSVAGLGSSQAYPRDRYSHVGDDDVMIYEKNGGRVLPQSWTHGKSSLPSHLAGSSDHGYASTVGDERTDGYDERLIYQAALQGINQPKFEANLPEGLLSVPLLKHQKIALAWMLQKETRSLHCLGGILADDQGLGKTISMIALIQMQKYLEMKSKSEDQSATKPEALNLDEDDDSSTVVSDKINQTVENKDSVKTERVETSHALNRRRPAAGTLVVCPASVLRQWARELDDKVSDQSKLSVLIYHGGTRTKDPVELAKFDVVMTTYAIVTNELPKQPLVDDDELDDKTAEKSGLSSAFSVDKKGKKMLGSGKRKKKGAKGMDCSSVEYGCSPLARVGWCRVILDEAQTIKNHRTQVARACCSLRAKRRWCLSGTPIQNSIDDLYSYFRFLRYEPYSGYKGFYGAIKLPISRNSLHGYKKLRAVLAAVMLRQVGADIRSFAVGTLINGEPIIRLPPKSICLKKVDFSIEERAFYTQLEADSRSKFKAYAAAGTVNQNYANILLMLLRLRQACDHPLLVKGFNSDSVQKVSVEMAKRLPKEMVMDLLSRLTTSLTICRVCTDLPEDPVVTMCGHVFCYQCVSNYLAGEDNTCPGPGCKEQLGSDIVFSEATLRSCMSNNGDAGPSQSKLDKIMESEYSSSKIRAILDILFSQCEMSEPDDVECTVVSSVPKGPIKTIIFSQWTGMLNLVEYSLNQTGLVYRRLDGTMSLNVRDKAVKDFNTNPEVTVMLMSLKAGNLGLNMVAACHVILLDLWWNPSTEDQAVDRAHRIGQTRPVTVTRLTIKDTVEDRILSLQDEKRKMVSSAFGEDQSGGTAARLTVEDLRFLFMDRDGTRDVNLMMMVLSPAWMAFLVIVKCRGAVAYAQAHSSPHTKSVSSLTNFRFKEEFVAHSSAVNCLKIGRKSSRLLVTGGEDHKSLSGHTSGIDSVGFDSSEVLVAAGAASGTIKLWDLEEAKIVRTLTGHRSNCISVDFHPFGEFFASGSLDTNLKIWDIRKKGCIHTYKGHTRGVNAIRFTPDGRWVVSGGEDNTVKLWDLTAGKLLHDFKCHEGQIQCIDFHPHEFLLATGSADKTVKFFDLETFELIGSSSPEASGVRCLTFNPDGRNILCGFHESLKRIEPYALGNSQRFSSHVETKASAAGNQSLLTEKTAKSSLGRITVSQGADSLVNETKSLGRLSVSSNSDTTKDLPKESKILAPVGSVPGTPQKVSLNTGVKALTNSTTFPSTAVSKKSYVKANPAASGPVFSKAEVIPVIVPRTSARLEHSSDLRKETSISGRSMPFPVQSKTTDFRRFPSSSEDMDQPTISAQPGPLGTNVVDRTHFPAAKRSIHGVLATERSMKDDRLIASRRQESSFLADLPTTYPDETFVNAHLATQMRIVDINLGMYLQMKAKKEREYTSSPEAEMVLGTDEDYIADVMELHGQFVSSMQSRLAKLQVLADVTSIITERIDIVTLDICTFLLPVLTCLLESKMDRHLSISMDLLLKLVRTFGTMIYTTVSAATTVGVDIEAERRLERCNLCFVELEKVKRCLSTFTSFPMAL